MKIGIDMMGGDFAPLEAVKGIGLHLEQEKDPAHLVLIGTEASVMPMLAEHGIDQASVTLVHTDQVIGMHEHPTKALREKPGSSIAVGFRMLASGELDAFISAGNTGAMMVGSLFSIKVIEGVLRPTIGAYLPREDGSMGLLVDVGLNADCKPENLLQFGILGSLFVKYVWNVESPRVALLNIGEEEGKGNLLTQAAYPLLRESTRLNFTGNVEGRDVFLDKADVIVCEGFTGNVVLKLAESIYDIAQRRGIRDAYLDRFHFEQYGGVPVLGVSKPVIIGHGISGAAAFNNMILMAEKMIRTGLMDRIRDNFAE